MTMPYRAQDFEFQPIGGGKEQPAKSEAPKLDPGSSKIRTFENKLGARHEDSWNRTPNTNQTGAIHVKSFHCKCADESLRYLDQQVNEWLDAHPQYEVKFSTCTVGQFTGKTNEPHLVVQVWV